MNRAVGSLLAAGLLLAAAAAPAGAQGRSFVGRRLPGLTYHDTEGHAIRAEHYEGSVLVLYGGIPW